MWKDLPRYVSSHEKELANANVNYTFALIMLFLSGIFTIACFVALLVFGSESVEARTQSAHSAEACAFSALFFAAWYIWFRSVRRRRLAAARMYAAYKTQTVMYVAPTTQTPDDAATIAALETQFKRKS